MAVHRDTTQRRQKIIEQVRRLGSVQVAALAQQFAVSAQTIRKDLRYLSDHGVLARAYGGGIEASAINPRAIEPSYEDKRVSHLAEKRGIGLRAAELVQPGATIILDSGTTAIALAQALPDTELTVLTNDFGVAAALAPKSNIRLIMLGGELRRRNMAFYGGQTVEALNALQVDLLFLGVDGFDLERGITTHYEPEAQLNRKMVASAQRVIAITDSSKFGQVCLHRILPLQELHALVTDAGAPQEVRDACRAMGVDLLIASDSDKF